MGHLSLGSCRHHTNYHILWQQQNAGSAVVPDGRGISDNSSEAMMARENGGSCPKSSPQHLPSVLQMVAARWALGDKAQVSEQARHNGIKSAEHDVSFPSVEYMGAPADKRGNRLAIPLPTCWYPNCTQIRCSAESKNQRDIIPYLPPQASAPSGQGMGTFRSSFPTLPASLNSESIPLLPSGTGTFPLL